MINFLARKIGKERALVFSFANKVWAMIIGLVNLIFVTNYCTPTEQGFYYTFYNILIFQTLLDVGFGIVLVQFISHEWTYLKLTDNNIEGEDNAKGRMAALIRISLKWYMKVGLAFFLLIGFGGYLFLQKNNSNDLSIFLPWILLCASVSGSLMILPFRFFLEGSNRIEKSQQILLISSIVGGICSWLAFFLKAGLYAPFINAVVTFLVTFIQLKKISIPYRKLRCFKHTNDKQFWKEEFWRQQWRIALSWLCGYIMYQLFVPIAFYFRGPIEAGKIGATLQIFNAILAVGYILPNVNAPKLGMLGAQKKYGEIIRIVNKISVISISVALVSFLCIMASMIVLDQGGYFEVTNKFIDIKWMAILLAATIIMQRISTETIAVRYQKEEPYLICSIVSAIATCILMILLGRPLGTPGLIISFWIGTVLIGFYWSHLIYKRFFRLKWSK